MSFVSKLFSSKAPKVSLGEPENKLPTSFASHAPGYSLTSSQSGTGFTTSLARTGSFAQSAFDSRFPRQLTDIDNLRGSLTPGFSALRKARLDQIGDARSSTLGNLRDTFARRRLSGSSFAQNESVRAEKEFAQAASDAEAQSFLEELDANLKVLDFEGQQLGAALSRELEGLGIASSANVQLADLVSRNTQFEQQLAAEVAQINANLKAQSAQGQGSLFGSILGTIGSVAGTIGGAALGGPAGAALGGSLGSSLGGGYSVQGGGSTTGGGSPFLTTGNPFYATSAGLS